MEQHIPFVEANHNQLDVKPTVNLHIYKSRKLKVKSWIKERFFILNWIFSYNLKFAVNDLIAGITLGLTIIPESIACALLAGLPSHYGLCSAFIGPFVYLIFGTVEKVLIGPTSLVALVTVQFTMGKPIEFAFILTLLAGIVELLMGIFQLGFIFDFISMPVIKAFSSATAVLVIESQIKVILGIKYLVPGFVNSIQTLFYKIDETRLGDTVMGLASIGFLISLNQLEKIQFSKTKRGNLFKLICSYTSLSRNALIVLVTASISFFWVTKLSNGEELPFRLSENVEAGLPKFTFPSFYIVSNNQTYYFLEICSELGASIFVIPMVSILTNISIAKALTPRGLVNANQELMTLGLCNILGSGVQSMPTCGAFSRAAISAASGIKTSIAGLYSGVLVIFALSVLTPYFHYIPESCLAAILICAIVSLIDLKLPLRLWKECKRDFITWISCFVVCIGFGVEIGLFFGICITVSHLLYLWARPEINVKADQIDDMQYIRITPCNGMYFPGIDYLREKALKACIEADFQVPVVIDCKKITGLDYTAAQGISKLAFDLEGSGNQALILYYLNIQFQKLIDPLNNVIFCHNEEKLKEILTQESLRNGIISLKDHVRASIDLVTDLNNELQELNSTKIYNEQTILNLQKPSKKHWIYRRVYILSWIKDYDKSFAVSDLIAGLTLGLTIIPQSIAYASLAGLPSQYGLYAAFMGAFVYMIFGTIKEVSIGPTSLMALLTLQYTYNKPAEFAIILAFFAGIVELTMGLLNIGFIVDFISDPVTSAFTSATAIIVIASQIKNFLGIKIAAKGITETLYQIILKINETSCGDALLGCFCTVFLLVLRQLNLMKLNKSRKSLKKFFWYISISRNALIVIITSIMAYFLKIQYGNEIQIKLSGNVESGVPVIQLPPFTIVDENDVTYQFFDIIKELGSGIFIIPIVGVLANVAIAKAFTKGKLDASQEMFALGLCNIMGSLFKGIPTCGAFTRSAVSNASGVRTPIAGLYSGIMVIFALSLFTPYFKYIPKATLASVLICAVIFMVDLKIVLKLYKKNKRDLIAWSGCFISCLVFGVEIGLLCGIAISIIFILIKLARPEINVHIKNIDAIEYIHIQSNSEVIYAAMDFLRTKVNIACATVKYQLPVVIDCSKISYLDYTSIQNINLLCKEMNENNLPLVFQNLKKELHIFIEVYNNITFCDGNLTSKNLTNV